MGERDRSRTSCARPLRGAFTSFRRPNLFPTNLSNPAACDRKGPHRAPRCQIRQSPHKAGFSPGAGRGIDENHPWFSPFGRTSCVQICSRQICRTLRPAAARALIEPLAVRYDKARTRRALSYLAEREGFEPSMELLTPYSLSRGAPSATRPPLHKLVVSRILLAVRALLDGVPRSALLRASCPSPLRGRLRFASSFPFAPGERVSHSATSPGPRILNGSAGMLN